MFNVKVEYESTPIRHIAVQCPSCNKWFHGLDITRDKLSYDHEIFWASFKCPVCEKEFGGIQDRDIPNIEEVNYPDIYKDCLQKKEIWE